jgi:hypothetical protein
MSALTRFLLFSCFIAIACRTSPSATAGTPVSAHHDWRVGRARPQPLRVALVKIPGLSTAARVDVIADRAVAVAVRYGQARPYTAETPKIAVSPSGTASTTIIGLEAGATSHVEVTASYPDGSESRSGDLTVTTSPLEPDVPAKIEVAVHRNGVEGILMLSMNRRGAGDGFTVMADRSGRVIWYRRFGGGAFGLDWLAKGRVVLHQSERQELEEIAIDGTVVRTWRDDKSVAGIDGHDIRLLPNGNALVLGAEARTIDASHLVPGGRADAIRWDTTLTELAPNGSVAWRWSSWAHVTEPEMWNDTEEPFNPNDYEVAHANSIELTPTGGVLLSFRNTSSVVNVDRATGNVLWRLGGRRSDFRIERDPLGGFNRQHDARLVEPNRILLFDNGNFHAPPESRAVEYVLDEKSKTATMVWQFRRPSPLFARVAGSVERLPNGHTLISWGPRGVVTEVDHDGAIVWEAKTPGFGVYRARAVALPYP